MFPARCFAARCPAPAFAAEAVIVALRFYAARGMAGSQPVTLCTSGVNASLTPAAVQKSQDHAKSGRESRVTTAL